MPLVQPRQHYSVDNALLASLEMAAMLLVWVLSHPPDAESLALAHCRMAFDYSCLSLPPSPHRAAANPAVCYAGPVDVTAGPEEVALSVVMLLLLFSDHC